jgi:ribosomal protein S18 acetylase RimI-like enzyme
MTITFEPPTPDDAQSLTEAQVRAFHHDSVLYPEVELGGPPGYDSVEQTLADMSKYLCHKILYDGQIVGGIVVFDRGEGHYHLDRIYIDPAYQNHGIGTQAMRFIEATYPARRWTLDTPTWAVRNQHFYEKFGYVKVGEREEEGGNIILIMYEKVVPQT